MSKPTGISHNTLSWVKKELDETLRQAAESLEIYSQDPSDPTHLQFCGSHLHQVHGILQMLELFGAAMLVEEMEQVAKALLRGEARQIADAQQALMQAILQLGDYLERVQAGLQDVPILLLPLLNDLRAVRNANLLTEHALFSPDLEAVSAGRSRPHATAAEPLAEVARRLRSQYQRGLLGVLREKNLKACLAQMEAALEGLDAASADTAVGDMWWIAAGLVEALRHGTAESAAATKMLLAQVDREIRRAIEVGEAGLAAEPRQELVKNLLYYVARAEPQSERVAAIQERYSLKRLLLDEQQLDTARRGIAVPNADTLQTVASILKEDLITAKDSLDLYARSGYTDQERLPPLAEGLRRVADTLGVLGLGVPRRVIKEQVARIDALADGSVTADEARVMEIAEALLYVESAIDGFSTGVTAGTEQEDDLPEADYGSSLRQLSDAEYHEIYGTAIGEVVADVARLKEAVAKLIQTDNTEGIGDTVLRFEELAATLRLLDKADVADLLSAVGSYVAANLVPGRPVPAAADLDTFADALAGIEYYLEAVRDGHAHPVSVLEKVSAALAKLGSTPPAAPVSELDWFDEPGSDSDASDDLTIDFDLAEAAPEPQESHDDVQGFMLDEALAAPADSLELAPLELEPLESTPAPAAPPVAAVEPAKKSGRINYDAPILADAIDDDILEIFIEEAGEVLETLREEFPRWRSDPENSVALTTVRRMYHTLKGSGRLAGALLLGEMAWSLESLLNRVLERAIAAGPEVYSVVEDSIAMLPALIDQIQGQPVSGLDVIGLMQRADALANPNSPDGPEGGGPATPKPAPADSSAALAEVSAPVEPAMEESLVSFDEPLEFPLVEEIVLEAPAADLPEFVLEDFELPTEAPIELDEIVLSEEPLSLAADAEDTEEPAAELGLEGFSVEFDLDEQPIEIVAEPAPVEPVVEAGGMDPILYDIFSRETADHLAVVRAFIDSGRQSGQPVPATKALVRALHTLTGSARMADVGPIAQIGRKLEVLAEHHVLSGRPVGSAELDLMERGGELVEDMVRSLASPAPEWPDIEPLLGEIDAATQALAEVIAAASNHVGMGFPLLAEDAEVAVAEADPVPAEIVAAESESVPVPAPVEVDPELAALFLEEAEDILRFLEMTVQRWEEELDHTATVAELHRSLHTLKGGARLAGFTAIGTLCHALESVAVDVADHKVPADDIFFNLLHACVDRLVSMIAEAKEGTLPQTPDDLLAAIAELRGSTELVEEQLGDLADAELVEVFLEEAADILEATEAALNHWQNEPSNEERVIDLQRALHTLKGGARMAGFKPIADLSHALETLLVGVQSGRPQPSAELFDLLERIYDRLFSMRAKAAVGESLTDADDLLAAIAALRDGTPIETPPPADEPAVMEPAAERPPLASAAAVPPAETLQTQAPQTEPAATPAAAPSEPPQQARDDAADAVRVRADLLDDMVNFAGEVSIYRARLEQQVGGMRFNLGELDQTVARLREQLRTLEIETEAQILYRFDREYETAGADAGPEDFDPLELDRFSRMQELSRALSESTNDLVSIQNLLDNLTRESETLLLQQARVNTELQDGLMRTRMVPFANLVPRMRRIVRQTCHELGKKAQLKVLGARGEMDRTVLERVTAPLEHMLRNAVAHGVEEPEVRRAAGKPEEGTITVALSREGADVVIRVSDDGGGIPLEAVRHKAIAQGLMPADAPLSDREVMQFILEAGFTTSEEVTQIAGRGVGMDVVTSEIKQLGGALEIESSAATGTTFTIRLPFTLAINQALLCQVGEDVYAIPLTSIEGVVRMTHEELERCFASPEASYYDYAGQRYEVRGLSSLLGSGEPQLPGRGGRAPIILVHAGDHRLAIQVDTLLGNREIVVKSVGPQISMVPGVYGATILADGRVVLILDVSSLVRLHITAPIEQEPVPVAAPPDGDGRHKVTVMVVDDSITMRKVATRLLERSGMAVVTAKDGVDAVARLQETIPDAMLLDIEMPRMDGYELATHMRNDERLRHVPIIMITSRTSEKHRERAFEIGVNRYLGKPYQEAELLANLQEVLEEAGVEV